MLVPFLLLLFCVKSIPFCTDQLYDSFRDDLLPGSSKIDPLSRILFINDGIETHMEFHIRMQYVADYYWDNSEQWVRGLKPLINFVSFDIPWCTTRVVISCAASSAFGLGKTSLCEMIDYLNEADRNFQGRYFVYGDQVPQCNGDIIVKIFGTTLPNRPVQPDIISKFTYDITGLKESFTKNTSNSVTPERAVELYQNARCAYKDNYQQYEEQPLERDRTQAACLYRGIGCASPRPVTDNLQDNVVIQFQCISTPSDKEGPYMLWSATNFDIRGNNGYDQIYFRFFTCIENNAVCNQTMESDKINSPYPQEYVFSRFPNRVQLKSPLTRLGGIGIFVPSFFDTTTTDWSGRTITKSSFTLSPRDDIIGSIPCVCGLNMFCNLLGLPIHRGGIFGNLYNRIYVNNMLPVAQASNAIIPLGEPNVTLYGNTSFDPDNLPSPLVLYWKVYSQPYGSPPVIIKDPLVTNLFLDTSEFHLGNYTFILYAGDTQDVTFDVATLMVLANVITAIVPDDFQQVYKLLSKCPRLEGEFPPASLCIEMDGSQSFGTNPEYQLSYKWTQIVGNPINVPYVCNVRKQLYVEGLFDANTSKARFIPGQYGDYGFIFNVSDNTSFAIRRLFIDVQSIFNVSRNESDSDILLPPDSPTRNYSGPDSPYHTFPDYNSSPSRPTTRGGSSNNHSDSDNSEFFQTLQEQTFFDKMIVLIISSLLIAILVVLTGYNIAKNCSDEDDDEEE